MIVYKEDDEPREIHPLDLDPQESSSGLAVISGVAAAALITTLLGGFLLLYRNGLLF